MKIVLDIGCGLAKIKPKKGEKVIGIDFVKRKNVDVVHDLEKLLPFPDNYADSIYSNHTFEHVSNAKQLVEECWRVTKPQGEIMIKVPHYSYTGMYTDLTHKTFFSSRSLDYYIEKESLARMSGYDPKIRFKMLKKRIFFDLPYRPLELIVNINSTTQKIYEWFFCWMFPSREILFIVTPIKKAGYVHLLNVAGKRKK